MTKDDQAPATKVDINRLQERLDQHDEQFQKVLEYIRSEGEETRHHFDVVVENIHHNMLSGTA